MIIAFVAAALESSLHERPMEMLIKCAQIEDIQPLEVCLSRAQDASDSELSSSYVAHHMSAKRLKQFMRVRDDRCDDVHDIPDVRARQVQFVRCVIDDNDNEVRRLARRKAR